MPRVQFGTSDNDFLQGFGEDDPDIYFDDEIYALDGDDTVVLAARPGLVWGGSGIDLLIGGAGGDWLNGETGNDTVYGNGGNDLITGGEGNDTLIGGWGLDTIYGGAGDDTILGAGFSSSGSESDGDADIIDAGAGNDTVFGGAGNDIIYGDTNTVETRPVPNSTTGQTYTVNIRPAGNDVLYGEAGDDWIFGFAGNDTINGGAGNDVMFGGLGNDFIFDLEGDNFISTGLGADYVQTGEGNDVVYSGGYADFLAPTPRVTASGFSFQGEPPADTNIVGVESAGNWRLQGGVGNADPQWVFNFGLYTVGNFPTGPVTIPLVTGDTISTGGGNDIIFGGSATEVLLDGEGNDSVTTGGGRDTLYMGGGLDVINLTGTTGLPVILAIDFRGAYNIETVQFTNPETIIYDRADAVGGDDLDVIYGFSGLDGDRIQYDDALGSDVTFTDDGSGGVWLANSEGIFAAIANATVAEVEAAFSYF